MPNQPPIKELPPDPKLKGWPQPIGWMNWSVWLYHGENYNTGWMAIGNGCYVKGRLRGK